MRYPPITIIIVQYNNYRDTIGCLESIKNLNYPNFYATVIDNASSIEDFNATRLFIESLRDKRFKIIRSDKNLGYAGGNNLGIKKTSKKRADCFFILNPDVILESDTLTKLAEAAEADSQIGIAGPAINEGNRTIYGGIIKWLKPELNHSEEKKNETYVIGAAMLIKRKIIEKIGLFDERYFIYFEDADYNIRAKKVAYKLAIIPDASINHAVSSSTNKLGSALLLRYHFRNAHIFNWKNGPLHIKLILPFWSFFIIIKQITKLILMPDRREISGAILAGVLDFYKGRFGQIK